MPQTQLEGDKAPSQAEVDALKKENEKLKKDLDNATKPAVQDTYSADAPKVEDGAIAIPIKRNGDLLYTLVVKHASLARGIVAANVFSLEPGEDKVTERIGSRQFNTQEG